MQPNHANNPILELQAHYRTQAERAIDRSAPHNPTTVIIIPPADLLQLIGQGNDREKLIIANREGQTHKADLAHLTAQLSHLVSAGPSDALHSLLTILLRQYTA